MSEELSPLALWPWSLMAQKSLQQPILPGWIFANAVNINDTNSSAPEIESEIVSQESYGRQLGRIIDALCEIIAERPATARSEGMKQLLKLQDKIEGIKARNAERRLENVRAWLAGLKRRDELEYRRVAEALRAALGSAGRAGPGAEVRQVKRS
jgi:hypothetical protein